MLTLDNNLLQNYQVTLLSFVLSCVHFDTKETIVNYFISHQWLVYRQQSRNLEHTRTHRSVQLQQPNPVNITSKMVQQWYRKNNIGYFVLC